MEKNKNKIAATFFAIILMASMAISIGAISTVSATGPNPIPGHPTDSYDAATYNAIQQGMYWTGMDANASATRILLWNRFHDQIPTHVFIVTAPSPIGVGQAVNVVLFNPQVPPGNTGYQGPTSAARYDYTFTVQKPDGTSQEWPTQSPPGYNAWSQNTIANVNGTNVFRSDATGSTYTTIIPDQVGNWTLTVHLQKLQFLWNVTTGNANNDYYGTYFLASNFTTTLVVQNDPVPLSGLPIPALSPMPAEFWTRPINQENYNWWPYASNWLHTSHDYNNGGGQNQFQPDGTGPNSGHILWTRPTEDSGIVGGTGTSRPGNSYDTGAQYQPRFTNPIIMYGRLYFSPNVYSSGSSELLDAVDLKTGNLLWETNTSQFYNPALNTAFQAVGTSITGNVPQFGYLYSEDNPNQHGIDNPGWLFTTNYGLGYQAERGIPQLHIANVPSSAGYFPDLTDPTGAQIRFIMGNQGSTLAEWNSSRVVPGIAIAGGNSMTSLTIEGNVPLGDHPANTYWNGSAWLPMALTQGFFGPSYSIPTNSGIGAGTNPSYDWNTTLTYQGQPFRFANTPNIYAGSLTRKVVWGYNGTWPQFSGAPNYAFPDAVTVWEISIDPNTLGQVLMIKNITIDDPVKNTNYIFEHANADEGANGVFIALEEPDMIFHAYDMSTGAEIWQTDAQAESISPYNYYTWSSLLSQTQTKMAYGMFYTSGYGGTISAYNITTGKLVWRTAIIPPGYAGQLKSSPAIMNLIADGKIYVGAHEHSAETPLEGGEQIKALNATTGEYVWAMSGWVYPYSVALADGVYIYWNDYDAQIYAIGKGPTSLTVNAPNTGVTTATPITITGTVTDVSAGTQQSTVKANHPNGVAAVSDASQSAYMEYIYMQHAKPTNTTGVPVVLSVIDSNGNTRQIGKATSDATGAFGFTWTPDISGDYTIIASFAGSESYYGSSAQTYFHASDVAHPTSTQNNATSNPANTTDLLMYIGVAAIAIIIAIAVATVLILRKRP